MPIHNVKFTFTHKRSIAMPINYFFLIYAVAQNPTVTALRYKDEKRHNGPVGPLIYKPGALNLGLRLF